ncbi:MAG: hypothetical protein RL139_594, partial [Gemmatimonadota bacterium]
TELAQGSIQPIYRLHAVPLQSEPYGGPYSIASAAGYADEILIAGPPTLEGPRLSPASWSSTLGGFTLPLAGDITTLVGTLTRGTSVVLEMGFVGWARADFEIIAIGRVIGVRGADPAWELVCDSALALLGSRLTRTAAQLPLFYGVGASTEVAVDYTAGDTTLDVDSVTGFQRETGGSYGVKVTPASGDDPYYLIATGTSGSDFTGCGSGSLGFAVSDAAAGSIVDEIAYLEGHPLDIVRRLLISGAYVASTWDTYPDSWGWGIPETYVDVDDIETWKTYVVLVGSGSYLWQMLIEEPIDDPYTWLSGELANAGLFLTVRQGLITCRGGQAHTGVTDEPYMPDLEIFDQDIVSCRFLDLFDTSQSVEYAGVDVVSASGTTSATDDVQTLPAVEVRTYDVSSVVYQNEAAIRSEMSGRLTGMSTRIPECPQLVLRGLVWSALTVGDVIPVTTDRLRGRLDSTIDGYDARRVYVVQVSADHAAHTTTIVVLAYPTTSAVFGG